MKTSSVRLIMSLSIPAISFFIFAVGSYAIANLTTRRSGTATLPVSFAVMYQIKLSYYE